MKSTAHLFGHPVHPMLIPYPFALLTSAAAFDLWARLSKSRTLPVAARHMTSAGLASAVGAALPGVVDYFGTVPAKSEARRQATWHALLNSSALGCFAVANAQRDENGRMPAAGLALSLVGTGLMSLGGWLGGELVYRHHVAVEHEGEDKVHPIRELRERRSS